MKHLLLLLALCLLIASCAKPKLCPVYQGYKKKGELIAWKKPNPTNKKRY